ncbi:MAG: hypothetical protein Q9209_003659 [Squamulea sp. 1 TL-2023]
MCRFTRSEELLNATDNQRWYRKHQRQGLPTGLFYANKWLSATALAIFYQEVPFYINIYPWGTRYHDQSLLSVDSKGKLPHDGPGMYRFRSHTAFEQLPHFRLFRNYRVNIIHDSKWYNAKWLRGNYPDRNVIHTRNCRIFKEQLRFVSDTLAANSNIQSLYISVPCRCCQGSENQIGNAYPKTLEFLEPLRRLQVAKPVVVKAVYDDGIDGVKGDVWLNTCSHPECQHFQGTFQASLSQLDGERISHEEETWRRIKAMDHGNHSVNRWEYFIFNLWKQLNRLQEYDASHTDIPQDAKIAFESAAKIVQETKEKDLQSGEPEEVEGSDK